MELIQYLQIHSPNNTFIFVKKKNKKTIVASFSGGRASFLANMDLLHMAIKKQFFYNSQYKN